MFVRIILHWHAFIPSRGGRRPGGPMLGCRTRLKCPKNKVHRNCNGILSGTVTATSGASR